VDSLVSHPLCTNNAVAEFDFVQFQLELDGESHALHKPGKPCTAQTGYQWPGGSKRVALRNWRTMACLIFFLALSVPSGQRWQNLQLAPL